MDVRHENMVQIWGQVLTWAIGDRAALVIGYPHRQVVTIHERTVIVVTANVPTQGPFSNRGWRHASSGTGVANEATLVNALSYALLG
jgi:hypothetical protein